MDHPLAAPVGAPETKVEVVHSQHTSEPDIGCVKESEPEDGKGQQVVQRAEDNPRPAITTADEDVSLGEPAGSLQPINAIPPNLSRSARARQTARIQATRRWIPAPILCRLKTIYLIPFFMWIVVTTVILFVALPTLAMVIGNSVCKAVNRPHFPRTVTAFSIGAAGSWIGTISTYPLGWLFGMFLERLDNRAREWHVRSGRIPANSTRSDGHFPVILLWIPFFYPSCIVASAIGTDFAVSGVKILAKADVNRMCAIGAAIAVPIFVLFVSVYLTVSAALHDFVLGVIQGFPEKEPPIITFDYLYRQVEALVWLLSPKKTSPTRTDIP